MFLPKQEPIPTAHQPVASTRIETGPNGDMTVWTVWSIEGFELDRTDGYGWGCGKNRSLAERLIRCVNDQKAYHPKTIRVVRDVYGLSYVAASSVLYWRHANKSLRMLGY